MRDTLLDVLGGDPEPLVQTKPVRPGLVERVEFEYIRHGTLCLMANLTFGAFAHTPLRLRHPVGPRGIHELRHSACLPCSARADHRSRSCAGPRARPNAPSLTADEGVRLQLPRAFGPAQAVRNIAHRANVIPGTWAAVSEQLPRAFGPAQAVRNIAHRANVIPGTWAAVSGQRQVTRARESGSRAQATGFRSARPATTTASRSARRIIHSRFRGARRASGRRPLCRTRC